MVKRSPLLCRGLGAYPTSGRPGSGKLPRGPGLSGSPGAVVRDRAGFRAHSGGRGRAGRTRNRGWRAAGLLLAGRASADVEVVLAVVAVVADVEDLVVGQTADDPLGVGLLEDMD